MSETMALSSLSRALSRVDLPALGFPAITVGTPFLITLPKSKLLINWLMMVFKSLTSLARS